MKTPDCVNNAIESQITLPPTEDEEDNTEQLEELNADRAIYVAMLSKFFKYGECCTLEFDTETGTMEVLKNN